MSPKRKSGDAGNSDITKRRCKVLPLTEKIRMCRKKHSMCRVWHSLWFQASTRSPGMCTPLGQGRTTALPSGIEYVLGAGGFPRRGCLGRSLFSVSQRPTSFVLIFIPDSTLEGGRAGFIDAETKNQSTVVTQGPSRK